MDIFLKRCTRCLWFKSLNAFGKNTRGKHGKNARCFDCCRTYSTGYRESHREELRAKALAYSRTHIEKRHAYMRTHKEQRRQYLASRRAIHNAQKRAEYKEKREAILQRSREWYKNNLSKIQTYRQKHAVKRKAQAVLWAERNKEHIRAYRIANRDKTRARGQAWMRNFPERNAAREQRRRARKALLPDTWTAEQLAFMLDYWQHACAVCRNPKGLFWSLAHDHWIPIASADCPGTIAGNMIPLCHGDSGCNNSKHATDPHTWLLERFGASKARKIEQSIAAYFAQVALAFPEA